MTDVRTIEHPPAPKTVISVKPSIQERLVDQVIIQSSGIGLGLILSLFGLYFVANWLGLHQLTAKFMSKLDSDSESLRTLANAVSNMSSDSKDNHRTYVAEHDRILNEVGEVKDLVKEINHKLK